MKRCQAGPNLNPCIRTYDLLIWTFAASKALKEDWWKVLLRTNSLGVHEVSRLNTMRRRSLSQDPLPVQDFVLELCTEKLRFEFAQNNIRLFDGLGSSDFASLFPSEDLRMEVMKKGAHTSRSLSDAACTFGRPKFLEGFLLEVEGVVNLLPTDASRILGHAIDVDVSSPFVNHPCARRVLSTLLEQGFDPVTTEEWRVFLSQAGCALPHISAVLEQQLTRAGLAKVLETRPLPIVAAESKAGPPTLEAPSGPGEKTIKDVPAAEKKRKSSDPEAKPEAKKQKEAL